MPENENAAPKSDAQVVYWLEQLESSRKWHESWHSRGEKVVERYLDEKNNVADGDRAAHSMNVLWSNVQTIQPALYAKTPAPKVQRRFRDKDPVGRWGATVLERTQAYELDAYDDDYHYRLGILDYLLPGRGNVWVHYEPTFEGEPEKLAWECCRVKHVKWRDFRTNASRTWDEVTWVARRVWLSRAEAKAQRLNTAELSFTGRDGKTETITDDSQTKNKAEIWEIWSKTDGKIFFVSRSSPKLLREPAPPPFKLDGFFPCPRPLTATVSTDSILPVPDFCQYENQAAEIDKLTQKINLLTKALRVAGIYDATQSALGRLLDDDSSNVMIACENWAALQTQGGIDGSVMFMPLAEIVAALQQAYISRDQAKQAMYEVMGLGDIIRGASDPDETARAQEIKSQWGGIRIKDRQKEVQRWIRDTFRIKAEIHATVFQPETLRTMSNVPLLLQAEKNQLGKRKQMAEDRAMAMAQANPEAARAAVQQNPQLMQLVQPLSPEDEQKLREPAWEDVVKLLKDKKLRGYRIDVETDSTVTGDVEAEKKSRIEAVGALTSFMQAWGPMVMQMPKLAPLAGATMEFGIRPFGADDLENEVTEFVDGITQEAIANPQPQGPAPDPKMQLAEKQSAHEMQKMDREKELAEADHGLKRDDMAFRREELTARQNESAMKTNADLQGRAIEAQRDVQVADASRPRLEDAAPFSPMFEAFGQQLMQGFQMLAQQQQEVMGRLQQMSEQQAQAINAGLTQIAQLVAAPKDIAVKRDKNGRISGALATPQVAGNA